jgi:hypothetical protein
MMSRVNTLPAVVLLVEELLNAHLDTIEMALAEEPSVDWLSHIDYLQALHREGEALMARIP